MDYRGLQPLDAFMTYESRGEEQLVYDGFTPGDLVKILDGCGFTVDAVDDNDEAPVLRAVRRGITTTVTCADRVPEQDVFLRAILTAQLEVSPEIAAAARDAAAPVTEGPPDTMTFGTTLMFDGGVTVGWVVRRLQDWDAMTWAARNSARKKKGNKARPPSGHVH